MYKELSPSLKSNLKFKAESYSYELKYINIMGILVIPDT